MAGSIASRHYEYCTRSIGSRRSFVRVVVCFFPIAVFWSIRYPLVETATSAQRDTSPKHHRNYRRSLLKTTSPPIRWASPRRSPYVDWAEALCLDVLINTGNRKQHRQIIVRGREQREQPPPSRATRKRQTNEPHTTAPPPTSGDLGKGEICTGAPSLLFPLSRKGSGETFSASILSRCGLPVGMKKRTKNSAAENMRAEHCGHFYRLS